MTDKKKIKYPIIVEGRYDKAAIASVFDATVITTNGFSIFNSKEKQSLIKKLAERGGIILLTDSDSGGKQIRRFLSSILPNDKIYHLYTPQIEGKERRKQRASKAGFLGVEGVGKDVLENVLEPFASGNACKGTQCGNGGKMITKVDFYNDGLSGGTNSAKKRERLALHFGLPADMSAKALLEALNLIFGYEEYKRAMRTLFAN